ncbi:MAG: hypothetical protein ACRDGD_10805 [Candidatus Limnocylindria bacterium]
MTEQPENLEKAVEDHDVTLALTPGQLLLLVIGLFVLARVIKRLRG